MQSPPIKSRPFSYGSGFFLGRMHYYAFIVIYNCKKTHFFNGFPTKNSKIVNGPTFNQCISMSFTQKNQQKFHPQP